MSPDEIKHLRARFELTQAAFGRFIGYADSRSVYNIESGGVVPSVQTQMILYASATV